MQTQRDHVHAHQFLMGRMSNALVLNDPDVPENPGSRPVVGLLSGLLVGLLVVAGFGIYGWLVPGGSKAWREEGAIIVEKETGVAYLLLDGELHPSMNMASAQIVQGTKAHIKLTARRSLAGVPRGAPVGIPGAPAVLPDPAKLAAGPWLVCPDVSGRGFGLNLDPSASAHPLAADRFVLVTVGRDVHLIWRGLVHRVLDRAVLVALGVSSTQPVKASQTWLDQLPKGDDLDVPAIAGAGKPGPKVAGRRYTVGTLFHRPMTGRDEELFVQRRDGLAPIDATRYAFLLARHGGKPVSLAAVDVVSAPRSADTSLITGMTGLIDATRADDNGRVLCAQQRPVDAEHLTAVPVLTDPADAPLRSDGTPTVALAVGSALVVYPVPLPGLSRTPDPWLVADTGLRYHVPRGTVLPELAPGSKPVPMPSALLAFINRGPELTRDAVVVAGKDR